MPYSSVWDRASRDMLSEKYKSLWTEDDRHWQLRFMLFERQDIWGSKRMFEAGSAGNRT